MRSFIKVAVLSSILSVYGYADRVPSQWNCEVSRAVGYWNSFAPPQVGDLLTLDLTALPGDQLLFSKGKSWLFLEKPLKLVEHDAEGARLVSEGITIDIFNPDAFNGSKPGSMWISADQGEKTTVNHIAHFLLDCEVAR